MLISWIYCLLEIWWIECPFSKLILPPWDRGKVGEKRWNNALIPKFTMFFGIVIPKIGINFGITIIFPYPWDRGGRWGDELLWEVLTNLTRSFLGDNSMFCAASLNVFLSIPLRLNDGITWGQFQFFKWTLTYRVEIGKIY